MNDEYVIANVTGYGQVKEFMVACPSANGSIVLELDGITTTYTNTGTSTSYVYFSSQFPANMTYFANNTDTGIAWIKLNSAGDMDMAKLNNPAVRQFVNGTDTNVAKSTYIVVGNLSFNKSFKMTMKSGTTISDNRTYSVIAEYSMPNNSVS